MNYAKNHLTVNNNPSNMPEMNMMEDNLSNNQNNSSTVSLSDIIINKTGDSDGGDNTSFYGTNSAILAINGTAIN